MSLVLVCCIFSLSVKLLLFWDFCTHSVFWLLLGIASDVHLCDGCKHGDRSSV